jgi:hypothetical protein
VVLGQHVRELVRGDAERYYERQVEEQFQWRSDPMLFVRIATRHPSNPMRLHRCGALRLRLSH